ncbi:hypothetical protein TrVFT333_008956 [Trichoderma virens FT-333]|nr:hypothetical protein TrVFT333_008956 [Trichoderma virens FT-333]
MAEVFFVLVKASGGGQDALHAKAKLTSLASALRPESAYPLSPSLHPALPLRNASRLAQQAEQSLRYASSSSPLLSELQQLDPQLSQQHVEPEYSEPDSRSSDTSTYPALIESR